MLTGRHFTIYNIKFIILSVLAYIAYVVFSNYFDYSKSMGMLYGLVVFPQFYLAMILVSMVQFLVDLGLAYITFEFSDDPVSYLRKYEIVRIIRLLLGKKRAYGKQENWRTFPCDCEI